MNNAIGLNKP